MTTTDLEVADHHAAGALADELPYWGWLPTRGRVSRVAASW